MEKWIKRDSEMKNYRDREGESERGDRGREKGERGKERGREREGE